MAIFIHPNLRLVCQGITGKKATYHTAVALNSGTEVVAGVVPGKGGRVYLGRPVFNTVRAAVEATSANASIIYAPPACAGDAILEAIDADIKLIVCVTEGIPVREMLVVKEQLTRHKAVLLGPNSPGIVAPGQGLIGIMSPSIYRPGCVGIVSRSGTLSYEAAQITSSLGLGQSTCVGIGGDLLTGIGFKEVLQAFEQDAQTKLIVLLGEVGGTLENEAAACIQACITKPVIAYVVGWSVPFGRTMGHAGAIVTGQQDSALVKRTQLKAAGAQVVSTLEQLTQAVSRFKSSLGSSN